MSHKEQKYIEKIEEIIEQFGIIQKKFVLDKEGVKAIVKFIETLEGKPPTFSLDDPVMVKGKKSAFYVIEELQKQLKALKEITPPEKWELFHRTLTASISLQLEGYREMAKVFSDNDPQHIFKGQEKVNEGMEMISARAKPEE